MERNTSVLEQAQAHVQELLLNHLPPEIVFHTYEHTEGVVEKAAELSEAAEKDEHTREEIVLAAWFHDTGYIEGEEKHEERSARLARDFLREKSFPKERTARVEKLILSTQKHQEPQNDAEKILHDAGWSFLGRRRFSRRAELFRLEREKLENKTYSPRNWSKYLMDLQLARPFITIWATKDMGARKNKNIARQRKELVNARKITRRQKTGKDFGRGIDTIYRVTLRNHISMSEIADGKANMMISINTLVLSILITAGTAGLSLDTFSIQENLKIIAPVFVLMLTGLLAIIFAVFSAIPKVQGKDQDKDKIEKKQSLLFFGDFLKIDRDEFVRYLSDLKNDQQVLYDDLARDLYSLGLVLKKKYRLLNMSYYVFMGGLILSFVTFVAFSLFYEPGAANIQAPISDFGK